MSAPPEDARSSCSSTITPRNREARPRCAPAPPGSGTLEAATGAEGIALADEHLPDVILLDLRLPDMDGTDAAAAHSQAGRADRSTIPLVAFSSLALGDTRPARATPVSPATSRSRSTCVRCPTRCGAAASRGRPTRGRDACPLDKSRAAAVTIGAPYQARDAEATLDDADSSRQRGGGDGAPLLAGCGGSSRASAAERHDPEGGEPLRDRPDRDEIPRGRRKHDLNLMMSLCAPGAVFNVKNQALTGKGADQEMVRDRNKAFEAAESLDGRHPDVQDPHDLNGTRRRSISSATTSIPRRRSS